MSSSSDRDVEGPSREDGRPERAEGERSRYLERFVDSSDTDWESLAAEDPSASREIEFLATMDRIRKAHVEVGSGSSAAEETGSSSVDGGTMTEDDVSSPRSSRRSAPERIGARRLLDRPQPPPDRRPQPGTRGPT